MIKRHLWMWAEPQEAWVWSGARLIRPVSGGGEIHSSELSEIIRFLVATAPFWQECGAAPPALYFSASERARAQYVAFY